MGLSAEIGGGWRCGAISRTGGKYSLTTDGSGTTIGGRYKDFGVDGFDVVVVALGVVVLVVVVLGVGVVGFRVGGKYTVFGGR